MYKLTFIAGVLGLIVGAPTSASATSVVFTDGDFSNFSTTTPFKSDPGITVTATQCSACGNPGNALQLQFVFPSAPAGTPNYVSSLGVIEQGFSYNPSTQGAISTINASVDKNITLTATGSNFTNTFRPLIEQNGLFYMATVAGSPFNSPPFSTGYLSFSASGLTAASFSQYDPLTGALNSSSNPDFAGAPIMLGLGQISTFPPGTTFTADYDNLSITLNSAVPELSTWAMLVVGFAGLGFLGYRRRESAPIGA